MPRFANAPGRKVAVGVQPAHRLRGQAAAGDRDADWWRIRPAGPQRHSLGYQIHRGGQLAKKAWISLNVFSALPHVERPRSDQLLWRRTAGRARRFRGCASASAMRRLASLGVTCNRTGQRRPASFLREAPGELVDQGRCSAAPWRRRSIESLQTGQQVVNSRARSSTRDNEAW